MVINRIVNRKLVPTEVPQKQSRFMIPSRTARLTLDDLRRENGERIDSMEKDLEAEKKIYTRGYKAGYFAAMQEVRRMQSTVMKTMVENERVREHYDSKVDYFCPLGDYKHSFEDYGDVKAYSCPNHPEVHLVKSTQQEGMDGL